MGKNVYILFGWNSTFYQHQMAASLKNSGRIDKIGGLVAHEKFYDFLLEQDEVDYDVLHHAAGVHEDLRNEPWEPERLAQIEREYGTPTLQPFAFRLEGRDKYEDMALNNYAELRTKQEMTQKYFDFFLGLFEEFEPDVYLTYSVGSGVNLIPYHLVHQHGGTAIAWVPTEVPGRYALMVDNFRKRLNEVNDLFEQFVEGRESVEGYPDAKRAAEAFISDFRSNPPDVGPTPHAMRSPFKSVKSAAAAPVRALRYFTYYHFDFMEDNYVKGDYRKDPISMRIVEELKWLYRANRIRYTDVFETPDFDEEEFVYVPLHLQPEASTLLYGRRYCDQIGLVRQISQSLPLDYRLYVKEHPNMVNRRSISYYKQLKDIDVVRLIHPRVPSRTLIRNGALTMTVTGTAGFESLVCETPAITFGDVNFNVLPGVQRGRDPDALPGQINDAIHAYDHDQQTLMEYVTALYAESFVFPGDGDGFTGTEATAAEKAEPVLERIEPYVFADEATATW